MGLAPLPNPLDVLRPSPVIPVAWATTPIPLVGRLTDLLTTGLRAEMLVVPVAGVGTKQRLAVTTSTLTELSLHATRSHVRAPEENSKPLIPADDSDQVRKPKKEQETYVKFSKKNQAQEQRRKKG